MSLLKGIFTVQRLNTSLFLGPPPVLVASSFLAPHRIPDLSHFSPRRLSPRWIGHTYMLSAPSLASWLEEWLWIWEPFSSSWLQNASELHLFSWGAIDPTLGNFKKCVNNLLVIIMVLKMSHVLSVRTPSNWHVVLFLSLH